MGKLKRSSYFFKGTSLAGVVAIVKLKKFLIMCKVKKALIEGNFRALATMQVTTNDIESILTDAEEALLDDELLVEETEARTKALQGRIERANKRINENRSIIENAEKLLEMMEQGEWISEMLNEE